MLKSIKNLLERNSLTIATSLTILIAVLSLLPISEYVPDLNFSFQDKLEHATAYLILGLSWFLVQKRYIKLNKHLIALSVVFFGIIIEVLQDTLTTYRTFDYYDILANTFGVFLAYHIFDRFYQVIQE